MICYDTNTIRLGGKDAPITTWSVWFQTPFGLFQNLEDALEKIAAHGLEAALSLRPVAVARGQSTYEVAG